MDSLKNIRNMILKPKFDFIYCTTELSDNHIFDQFDLHIYVGDISELPMR